MKHTHIAIALLTALCLSSASFATPVIAGVDSNIKAPTAAQIKEVQQLRTAAQCDLERKDLRADQPNDQARASQAQLGFDKMLSDTRC